MFAIIGLLLGFIIGFIFSSTMSQRAAQNQPVVSGNPNLPADHPQIQGSGSQDPQQVFADVQAAISKARSEPKNFEAQMKAAELYYKIERYDQAIEYLLKANQLQPTSFEAIVALGQVNLDAGHFEQAEKWYRAAALQKPDDVRILASLAYSQLQKGDAGEAEKSIAKLEKADPTNEDLPNFRSKLATLKSSSK
jgi:tetratricopeptide (TPR) repeat protein